MKHMSLILVCAVLVLLSLVSCQTQYPIFSETENTLDSQIQSKEFDSSESPATVFDGSFSTFSYEVNVIDGVCYLNFKDGNTAEGNNNGQDGNHAMLPATDFVRFSSLADMKQTLMQGSLTEEQIEVVKSKFSLTDNGFAICNVQELIQPAVPNGFVMDSVYWYGEDYEFLLRDSLESPSLTAALYLGNEGKWERKYTEWVESAESNTVDLHEVGTMEGFSAETYVVTTKVAQYKRVFLTLPEGLESGVTHIALCYVLRADIDSENVSDTIPDSVYIFGEMDGTPFDYYVYDFTEAPTVEWLSSFSIAPYVDTDDHLVS